MQDRDGNEYLSEGVFREIIEPERVVSSDEFGDQQDEEMSDLPSGMIVTTSFKVMDSKTKMTHRIKHQSVEDRIKHEKMGVIDGWNESLYKLAEYLAKQRIIIEKSGKHYEKDKRI